jgi:hypothetical protein
MDYRSLLLPDPSLDATCPRSDRELTPIGMVLFQALDFAGLSVKNI